MSDLKLNLRSRVLRTDDSGRSHWEAQVVETVCPARETALLLCDVWDNHCCKGALMRLEAMVGRMDEVVRAARVKGLTIVHAPSDTMSHYDGLPGRHRVLDTPRVEPPQDIDHPDPPLPIDDSDGGCDTGESSQEPVWTRQHPAIEIADEDAISDSGVEVYSFLRHRGIRNLLIMGVHTNICVLHRTFGIKQMVRWGVSVALIRDLTDTMYNPAMRPYVDHEEGTRLVVEFIEKFWCPSVASSDLLDG
jgi:nicotinamidase-related amidase